MNADTIKDTLEKIAPTEQQFQEQFDLGINLAKFSFDGTHKDIMPQLMIFGWSFPELKYINMLCALAGGFNEAEEKNAMLRTVAGEICKHEIIPMIATLVTESWVGRNLPSGVEPKDAITREEVAQVAGLSVDWKLCRLARCKIYRNDDGFIQPSTESFDVWPGRVRTFILERFFRFVLEQAKI